MEPLIMTSGIAASAQSSSNSSHSDLASPYQNANAKSPIKRVVRKRRYKERFIAYGFTSTSDEKPLCVVCNGILAQESMKPSKLLRHLESKHPELKDMPSEHFKHLEQCIKDTQSPAPMQPQVNGLALLASYLIALRIARAGEAHTIAEELIIPCTTDIVTTLHGAVSSQTVKEIPHSNEDIRCRIAELASDVRAQLFAEIRASDVFAIQVDESTDTANIAHLFCCVRYMFNCKMKEEMLFCSPLDECAEEGLFKVFSDSVKDGHFDWDRCVGISSDGAKAITERYSSLVRSIQEMAPNAPWVHCFIHRQDFITRGMPQGLLSVINSAVQIINFVKWRARNSRFFSLLCKDMGSEHKLLLLQTEIDWLSQGTTLQRLFELRDEAHMCLIEQKSHLAELFTNQTWVASLAYLADIFGHLNVFLLSLQGQSANIFTVNDKGTAFKRKLAFWSNRVINGNYSNFALLSALMEEDTKIKLSDILLLIQTHLEQMEQHCGEFFPADKCYSGMRWICNPFENGLVEAATLSNDKMDSLIELSSDETLRLQFKSENLIKFWNSARDGYCSLADDALRALIPFASSYLCDSLFSSIAALQARDSGRVAVENELLLRVCSIQPRLDQLCSSFHQTVLLD